MPLAPGTRLGPYEIMSAIGAGGMGEVYRARDTKLGREVAIKVLPAELAQDPERLARFEREAKLLASLNHPNIAQVYGFESATLPDGSAGHFLAMELVPGEELAGRLKRGAIPVEETLAIAKQIAEALEEAHEKGIVHRDLKPANVKLTPDGKVKVLDDEEPRFSPNGRELAFVRRRGGPYGELRVVDLASGEVRQLTHDDALAQSPAWSPDSLHVYFASGRGGTMNIWKIAASGSDPEQITAGQGDDVQPHVSSDGRRIVFTTYRENLGFEELDLAAMPGLPRLRRLTTDPARNQIGPVYSPDGARLAYFSNLKGVEKEGIWVARADGSNPVPLVQDALVNIFPRWCTPTGPRRRGSGRTTSTFLPTGAAWLSLRKTCSTPTSA